MSLSDQCGSGVSCSRNGQQHSNFGQTATGPICQSDAAKCWRSDKSTAAAALQSPDHEEDYSMFRYPAVVQQACQAAQCAALAAGRAALLADGIEAAHISNGETGPETVEMARELALQAYVAAQEAALGALALAESCYLAQGPRPAPAKQPPEPTPTVSVSGQHNKQDSDVTIQHKLICAYSSALLQLLKDPAGLQKPGNGYQVMQELGLSAEWAWLEAKHNMWARVKRLVGNLMNIQKGGFVEVNASRGDVLPHAITSAHWLLRNWAAGEAEIQALKQDLLQDAQQPQPADLTAATAKAKALRQLLISYKTQAILARPDRYREVKAAVGYESWQWKAVGRQQLSVWKKVTKTQSAMAAAHAAAQQGKDTAACDASVRQGSSPDMHSIRGAFGKVFAGMAGGSPSSSNSTSPCPGNLQDSRTGMAESVGSAGFMAIVARAANLTKHLPGLARLSPTLLRIKNASQASACTEAQAQQTSPVSNPSLRQPSALRRLSPNTGRQSARCSGTHSSSPCAEPAKGQPVPRELPPLVLSRGSSWCAPGRSRMSPRLDGSAASSPSPTSSDGHEWSPRSPSSLKLLHKGKSFSGYADSQAALGAGGLLSRPSEVQSSYPAVGHHPQEFRPTGSASGSLGTSMIAVHPAGSLDVMESSIGERLPTEPAPASTTGDGLPGRFAGRSGPSASRLGLQALQSSTVVEVGSQRESCSSLTATSLK